jgi:hypothetical protein
MSLNNPIKCRNCNGSIYFDPPGVRGRPFDVETGQHHQCIGGSGLTYSNKKSQTPTGKPCKFGCGKTLFYDTAAGYYREGSMAGPRHAECPNFPKDQTTLPVKEIDNSVTAGLLPKTTDKTSFYHTPKIDTGVPTELGELLSLIRELNTLQLGLSKQLKTIADNQDVNNRMTRAIRDILQEYKDEVIDTIKKPPMKFESGKLDALEDNADDDDDDEDVYDEFADVDDKTRENDV